jgi:uncharacterized repeat protein (TIGR01451 family)
MRARQGLDRDRRGLRLRQAIAAVAGKLPISQRLVDWVPRRAAVLATIAAALITASFTGEALAQVVPATITNSFSPSTVEVGGLSIMTVTVTNPNATPLTNVQFNDTQPAGIDLITQTGGTCSTLATGGGMFSINPGTETFSSTSNVLAAGQSCNITVRVRGTTVGAHVNTTSQVTSNEAGPGGPASGTLQVNAIAAPTIAKAFGAAAIAVGGTTSLSFTITNPNTSTSLTGVGFTDALPAGLVVATPNGLTGSCGGGTIAATAGGSSANLSGATLAANASCTFSINVTGTTAGTKVNTTSAVTSNEGGSGNTATATLTVGAPATTTSTTLSSSVNPSSVGQAVTFTATVTGASGTPTGTVTFFDGGTAIGTATLAAGAASFTTSLLTLGAHNITANYGGSAGSAASTSSALTQIVQVPADSVRLRALQIAVTKVEAQASGDAFAGAVAGAIADGFSEGGGALITPSGNGLRLNFAAEPDAVGPTAGRVSDRYDPVLAARTGALPSSGLSQSELNQNGLPASVRSFTGEPSTAAARVDDAFAGLAYAKPMVTKAPPPFAAPKVWQLWADVRGTGWNTDPSAGDIRGGQINAIAGLTRKLTPDFLVGVLGGYENFDYTSQTLNGRLKGDGWTVGGYLGWRLWPGVRFDAAVARSGISYNGVSGTAAASFPGNRWLATGGLTGTYRTQWLEIEPSAKVYAIWEHDNAYLDSLGTQQAENRFSTGRASSGVKVAYPMLWGATTTLAPYVGVYADYYFSSNNAEALLLPTQFVQGWAARVTSGLSYNVVGGAKVSVGGEVGGLGSQNFTTWSVRGRASVPF